MSLSRDQLCTAQQSSWPTIPGSAVGASHAVPQAKVERFHFPHISHTEVLPTWHNKVFAELIAFVGGYYKYRITYEMQVTKAGEGQQNVGQYDTRRQGQAPRTLT
jgi:hypothetical protein